jgi:hypothetical protein
MERKSEERKTPSSQLGGDCPDRVVCQFAVQTNVCTVHILYIGGTDETKKEKNPSGDCVLSLSSRLCSEGFSPLFPSKDPA